MLALFTALTGLLLGAADGYDLTHRFHAGDALTYSVRRTARDENDFAAVTQGLGTGAWRIELKVVAVTPEAAHLTATRTAMEVGGATLEGMPPEEIAALRMTVTVDVNVYRDGRIGVKQGEGPEGGFGGLADWLRLILIPGLPAQPVSVGHSWKARFVPEAGGEEKPETTTFRYRFDALDTTEGVPCCRISLKAETRGERMMVGQAPDGSGGRRVLFRPKRDYVYFLARDDGRVLKVMGADYIYSEYETEQGKRKVETAVYIGVRLEDFQKGS